MTKPNCAYEFEDLFKIGDSNLEPEEEQPDALEQLLASQEFAGKYGLDANAAKQLETATAVIDAQYSAAYKKIAATENETAKPLTVKLDTRTVRFEDKSYPSGGTVRAEFAADGTCIKTYSVE
jgi:hypothetical protein